MKQMRQIRFNLLAVGLFLLPAQGWTQSLAASDTLCPAGYAPYETVCISATNGDVVNQRRFPLGPSSKDMGGELSRACASRDIAAWTLIERHGEAQSLPSQVIAEAFFGVMDARRVCRAGKIEEGLAIYTRVTARLEDASR